MDTPIYTNTWITQLDIINVSTKHCLNTKKKMREFGYQPLFINTAWTLWKSRQCIWHDHFLSPCSWVTQGPFLFLLDSSRLWTRIWLHLMYHLRWVGKVLVRGCLAEECTGQAMTFWTKAWFEYGTCMYRYFEMFFFFFCLYSFSILVVNNHIAMIIMHYSVRQCCMLRENIGSPVLLP